MAFSVDLKLIVLWCRYLKLSLTSDNRVAWRRAGGRAVDLGGPSVYQEKGKFEIKQKTAAVFKRLSLFIGGPSMSIGPPLAPSLTSAWSS